jgi:hypothetical protein
MALILADRVRETSTTTGTGTLTLGGAVTSYQSFAVVGDANTTYYTIVNQNAAEWEVGIGTYTASGTTLARTTVLSSSNAGSLVNFSAGTKDVWGDYPAAKAVTTDTLAYPPDIGFTTPAAGAFTTLSASSTVSGTGFSTYLASPPAIGGTAAAAGTFTTIESTVATGTAPLIIASTTPVANLSIGGTAAKATNIAGGAANRIPYQTGANATSFISAPTVASTYLGWDGSAFTWGTVSATVNWAVPGALGSTTPNAVYVSSGSANAIPYFGGTGGKQILSSNLGYYAGNGPFLTIGNPSTTSYSAATMSGVLLKGISSGAGDAFFGNSADTYDGLMFGINFYTDPAGPSYKYKANGGATLVTMGANYWTTQVANSGVANADITFASAISLSTTLFSCSVAASFSSSVSAGTSVSATTSVSAGTSIKSTSTSAGVGYATGAGGAQTQSTSKSTGVTLNNICGQITMNAASLAAATSVSFTLTNSSIAANDVVIVNAANVGGSAPTANTYQVGVDSVLAGSCRIHVRNVSASAAAQALVLNFAVIKSVTA